MNSAGRRQIQYFQRISPTLTNVDREYRMIAEVSLFDVRIKRSLRQHCLCNRVLALCSLFYLHTTTYSIVKQTLFGVTTSPSGEFRATIGRVNFRESAVR